MAASSRRKGLAGEAEVAALLRQAGFDVRNLEGRGDFAILASDGRLFHGESKRAERFRLWEWIEQVEAECPARTPWVLFFRRNGSPWYAIMVGDELAKALA